MISLDLDSLAPESFDTTNAHGGLGSLTTNTAYCEIDESDHGCEHATHHEC